MWKSTAAFLLVAVAIGWHFRSKQVSVEVPRLPNEYWGPGNPQPDPKDIVPFKINVDKKIIDDLNKQLDRSLNREFVKPLEGSAWTYGISSTYLKTILKYWRTKYDWSKRQELLNKYPQFTTKIQGLNIHFYHVKPLTKELRVIPLLISHGWAGSVVEFQKIIPLLTTPEPGRDFVFELIIPSLPGFAFSDPAVRPGLGPAQIAVIFKNLMLKLGFNKFYTQGGDWGSVIIDSLAIMFPQHVIGVHSNLCLNESLRAYLLTFLGAFIPQLVIEKEHHSKMYPLAKHYSHVLEESGYFHLQATKPDTIGTALSDSPASLAAYLLEKFSACINPEYKFREDGGLTEKFTFDELLDNLMMYWVTNSITSSMRIYAENYAKANRDLALSKYPILVPSACIRFPNELVQYLSKTILEERYLNLIQFTHATKGGHFAAFEEPQILSDNIWSFVEENEKQLLKKKSNS